MKRRQFVFWIGRTASAYLGLAAGGVAMPHLLRINSVRLGEARAACGVDTCVYDSGLACETRDVCTADSSGSCSSDECVSDKSGNCIADYCSSDSSGECSSDQCASDSSGSCLADRCAQDSSGACVGDACSADSAKDCRSDTCLDDSSGSCRTDTCVADSAGECRSDVCVSDKSGGCVADRCATDSSGGCVSDGCRSDSSGACTSDTAKTDSSGACISDACTSDSSSDCRGDQCTNDSSGECRSDDCSDDASGGCSSDTCVSDTDTCSADTTCALDGECLDDGVCPADGQCLEDGGCLIDLAARGAETKAARSAELNRALKWLYRISGLLLCIQLLATPEPASAATFNVAAGDTAGLISAIQAANANSETDTINLAEGAYSLTSVDADNGIAGLPSITATMVINGSTSGVTIIERSAGAADFGVMHILGSGSFAADDGTLTLNDIVIRGGAADIGGGVFNELGELELNRCTVSHNAGGGIANLLGRLRINQSSIHSNSHSIDASASGGGVLNLAGDQVSIVNTTLYGNSVNATGSFDTASGGGLTSLGNTTTLTHVTLSGNSATGGSSLGGGLFGDAQLRSTIVAQNNASMAPDLAIAPLSLGYNLIGSVADSFIGLQANDLTGYTGLAAFSDDGTAGNGHLPLFEDSPAIDRGDPLECLTNALLLIDQIGQPRISVCDIGAIEWQGYLRQAVPALGPLGLLALAALLGLAAVKRLRSSHS